MSAVSCEHSAGLVVPVVHVVEMCVFHAECCSGSGFSGNDAHRETWFDGLLAPWVGIWSPWGEDMSLQLNAACTEGFVILFCQVCTSLSKSAEPFLSCTGYFIGDLKVGIN